MIGFRKFVTYLLGLAAIVVPAAFDKALDGYAIGGVVTLTLAALGANVASKWLGKEGSWDTSSSQGSSPPPSQ
jgi:hypothetical protein